MTDFNPYADTINSSIDPFPGLRSFDIWENHLFFGRDNQVDTLLKKLTDHRFVCVVGTSGSGKSSLVRAGLLPVLFGGFMAEAGSTWRIAIFRPGNDPIHNMASALNADDVYGSGDEAENLMRTGMTEATLESNSLGLVQVVRQSKMEEDENLLIVVDQFEELFRFKENAKIAGAADHAAAFVKLLLEAVHQRELPIYVVLTIRSDFLGDCAQYRDLPEAINDGQYLIPRLQREQLRAAIIGPVAVGGGKIAPRLVQQLLNDVGDNPDQLPILQHALMRTWDFWKVDHEQGEPIELRHYDAIGGMSKALSQHADEAYNELTTEQSRKIAEVMFKCLTERGPDNRGIRRPTRLKTICAVAEAQPEEVIQVVEIFRKPGRSFIMPPHGVSLAGESMLDISHESLMRVWERLEKWVDEDAESAQIYQRLVESAALYDEGHAGLWRDPELALAVEWREREKPNKAWAHLYHPNYESATLFLDASIRDRDAELADKRRRRRITQVVIIAFLIAASALTVWALTERSSATKSARAAEQQRGVAEQQKTIALQQEKNAKEQKDKAEESFHIAETQRQQADAQRKEAERQKGIAQQQQREALSQRQRAEQFGKQAVEAKDTAEQQRQTALTQKSLAERARGEAESAKQKAEQLQYISIARGLALKSVQLAKGGDSDLTALLALQSFHFNKANNGNPRDPDVYSALNAAAKPFAGDKGNVLRSHSDGVRVVAYSPDGSKMASAGSDGRVLLYDAHDLSRAPRQLAQRDFIIRVLAFSSDNSRLAYGGNNNTVWLISLDKPDRGATQFRPIAANVAAITFVGGGQQLATLDIDGHVQLWGVNDPQPKQELPFSSKIRSLAADSSGRILVGGTDNGQVVVWDLHAPTLQPKTFQGASTLQQSVAVSHDGRYVAAGGLDGVVRLWDRTQSQSQPSTFIGHRSVVNALAFSNDGKLLASGSSDGTVRLWNLERPEDAPIVIGDHTSWVWSVAFSPDGKSIISGSYDKTVRISATSTESIATSLFNKMKRNLTHKEWDQYIGSDVPYQKTIQSLGGGK